MVVFSIQGSRLVRFSQGDFLELVSVGQWQAGVNGSTQLTHPCFDFVYVDGCVGGHEEKSFEVWGVIQFVGMLYPNKFSPL
jgi:hypothetical protein